MAAEDPIGLIGTVPIHVGLIAGEILTSPQNATVMDAGMATRRVTRRVFVSVLLRVLRVRASWLLAVPGSVWFPADIDVLLVRPSWEPALRRHLGPTNGKVYLTVWQGRGKVRL